MHVEVLVVLRVENEPQRTAIFCLEISVVIKFFGEIGKSQPLTTAPNIKHFPSKHIVSGVIVFNAPTYLRCPSVEINFKTLKVILKQNLSITDADAQRQCNN